MAAYFRSVDVCPIDVLLHIEAKPAEVAGNSPASPVELEVGVDIGLAPCAAQRRPHLHHTDLVFGEGSDPRSNRKIRLPRQVVQHCAGGTQEGWVQLPGLDGEETVRRRERTFALLKVGPFEVLDSIGGWKDGADACRGGILGCTVRMCGLVI